MARAKRPTAPPEMTAEQIMEAMFHGRLYSRAALTRDYYLWQQDRVLAEIEAGKDPDEAAMMLAVIRERLTEAGGG